MSTSPSTPLNYTPEGRQWKFNRRAVPLATTTGPPEDSSTATPEPRPRPSPAAPSPATPTTTTTSSGTSPLRWFFLAALLHAFSWFSHLLVDVGPVAARLDEHLLAATYATRTAADSADRQSRDHPEDLTRIMSPGELTRSSSRSSFNCSPGLVYLADREVGNDDVVPSRDGKDRGGGTPTTTRVPRIIHQTSKSRCVTQEFANVSSRWNFDSWSYHFYDDEAIYRLFRSEIRTFPHLEIVASKCMLHGAIKSDVFRYLVMYRYGGIYADIDSAPNAFHPDTHLTDGVDCLFVVEAYGMLSQYFMAASPRHPLMWYAVQHSLANLLNVGDTGRVGVATTTGPHALHAAYRSFMRDGGVLVEESHRARLVAGTFVGTHNRSVTVAGMANNSNGIVFRDVLYSSKKMSYAKMDMTHFRDAQKTGTNQSCLSALYDLHAERTGAA